MAPAALFPPSLLVSSKAVLLHRKRLTCNLGYFFDCHITIISEIFEAHDHGERSVRKKVQLKLNVRIYGGQNNRNISLL